MIARLRRLAGSPLGKVFGALLGLVILGLLLKRLHDLWQEHPVPLDEASRPLLVLALLASFVAMTAYAMTWAPALRTAGAEPVPDMVAAYYAGGLGKYLPGGAWQYVGRAGILVRRGVPVGASSASLALEALASAAAAALLAPLAAGPQGLVAAAVAIVLVLALARLGALGRLVRRVPGFGGVELHRLPGLVARYVGVWMIFGVAFWLTARALFDVPASDVLRYAGVFAAAWVAGVRGRHRAGRHRRPGGGDRRAAPGPAGRGRGDRAGDRLADRVHDRRPRRRRAGRVRAAQVARDAVGRCVATVPACPSCAGRPSCSTSTAPSSTPSR